MALQERYNRLTPSQQKQFAQMKRPSMLTSWQQLTDEQIVTQLEKDNRKQDPQFARIASRPKLAKSDWKEILKAQSSLMDFGMTAPMGSMPRADEDAQIKREMAQMEQTLNQNKGRIKSQINQKVVDLATYRLEQLNKIKSMPFPQNVEEFNSFKEQYKQNF